MLEQFKKGDLVNFVYKNSCHETVHAYGTVEKYDNRYYYVSIGDDMPLIRVYCGKVHKRTSSSEFIMPDNSSKTVLIERKPKNNYHNLTREELERISKYLRQIVLGIGLGLIVLILSLFR